MTGGSFDEDSQHDERHLIGEQRHAGEGEIIDLEHEWTGQAQRSAPEDEVDQVERDESGTPAEIPGSDDD